MLLKAGSVIILYPALAKFYTSVFIHDFIIFIPENRFLLIVLPVYLYNCLRPELLIH